MRRLWKKKENALKFIKNMLDKFRKKNCFGLNDGN